MTTIHSAAAEGLPLGAMSEASLETFLGDGSMTHNATMRGRMSVVDVDGSRKVRVTLPANSLEGVVFVVDLPASSEEIWFAYDLTVAAGTDTWEPGFGGKLPGVGAALPGFSPPSGGDGPEDTGCDARWMWLGWRDGAAPYSWVKTPNELVGYPYHPTQPGAYGNNQKTDTSLVPGQKHRLIECGVMNTPGVADGIYRLYVDGVLVFEDTTWTWRTDGALAWNKLSFAVFRGGGDAAWEVDSTTTFDFDNLLVTDTAPDEIDPPTSGDMDLSTAVLYYDTVYSDGKIFHPSAIWADFAFPGVVLDPATTYLVEVDIITDPEVAYSGDVQVWLYTINADLDPATSEWGILGKVDAIDPPVPNQALTVSLTIGPGIEDWDTAILLEDRLLFDIAEASITAVRISSGGPHAPSEAAGSGLVLLSDTEVTVTPPLAALSGVTPTRTFAMSLPAPVLVDGRPQ